MNMSRLTNFFIIVIGGIFWIFVLNWMISDLTGTRKKQYPDAIEIKAQREIQEMNVVSNNKLLRLRLLGCYFRDPNSRQVAVNTRHSKIPFLNKKAFFGWQFLQYPLYSFSGNTTDQYNCIPASYKNPAFLWIDGVDNYHESYKNNTHKISDYDRNSKVKWGTFLGKKNNMELHRSVDTYYLSVGNFSNKKHDLIISYKPQNFNQPADWMYSFVEVETFLGNDFSIGYKVYLSKLLAKDPLSAGKYDNQFVEDFVQVIQRGDDILDHPEIIEKFIDNNERVMKYVHSISEEVKR